MKKIVSFIVCFALLVVLCPVFFTQDAEACGDCMAELREQGYEYVEIGKYELAVKGDEAVLIHYYGGSRDSDVRTFEHEVEGYRIVKVWDNAFETAPEKKIIIPEGVIELGDAVFEQCPNLEEVVLPSTLCVLGKAFTNCFALERVVIPEGIETISGTVFYSCDILKEVVLPSTLRRVDGLFSGCPMIETVVLPEGLESIGGAIFSNCDSVKSLEIPASVTYMAGSPIYGKNSIESLTVAPGNTYLRMENGCLYTTDGVLLYGMEGCTLPDGGITAIGDNFFSDATWLESLVIPDGVTSIGNNAFSGCTNLKEIVIPDSVTSIGAGAFWMCKQLKEVVIPHGVTSINASTFYYCSELKSVSLPEGITEIGNNAFAYCTALTAIALPETVTAIGNSAFQQCESLSELNIPMKLASVGKSAFQGSAITSVVLPDTVTEIGELAFNGCKALEVLRFPRGLTNLPWGCLSNCISLKELVIPEGVTHLGRNALSGLTGLEKLTLPSTLQTMDEAALTYMPSLKELVFDAKSTPYTLENGCLTDGNGTLVAVLMGHTLPEGIRVVGDYAFCQYQSNEPLFLPEGITSLGRYAFEYADLPEVVLPASLKYIQERAFSRATIENIFLPSTLEFISIGIFEMCPKLRQIDIQGPTGTFEDRLDSGYYGRVVWNVPQRRTDIYKISGDYRYEVVDGKAHIVEYLGNEVSVTVPSQIDGYTVTALGMQAFTGRIEIKTLVLPNTLKSIEYNGISNCHGLEELILPLSVDELKKCAIWYCKNLRYLYLPSDVSLGSQAVGSCSNLETVAFAGPTVPNEWQRSFDIYDAQVWVNVTDPDHPEEGRLLPTDYVDEYGPPKEDGTPDDPNEDDPNEDASDEAPAENSREESAEQPEEESEDTVSVPAVSEEESVSASRSESSSLRTIPEEDAEGGFPWGWIVAAVLIAGIGATIFFVRKKK